MISKIKFTILIFLLILFCETQFVLAQQWRQTNGPYTATISTIVIDSNGFIFVGTSNPTGVYRSTNNGLSWVKAGLTGYSVYSLALSNAGYLFAATHTGIYRSNNGSSWSNINNIIAISLIVGNNNNIYLGTAGLGIFRSTDNGLSWASMNNGLANLFVNNLYIDSSQNIYACTDSGLYRTTNNGLSWSNLSLLNIKIKSVFVTRNGSIFAGTNNGVFLSIDTGSSWQQVNVGLTNTFINTITATGDNIFIGTNEGVFHSTNSGTLWVNTGLKNLVIRTMLFNGVGDVFAGTEYGGVFSSSNEGTVWISPNSGFRKANVLSLSINAAGNVLAGTDVGVYYTYDNCSTWVNSGLTKKRISSIDVCSNNNVFVGTTDSGVFRSVDNCTTWVNTGLWERYINAVVVNQSDAIFVGTWHGAFRSTDYGNSWASINAGLGTNEVNALTVSYNGDIFAGKVQGVYRTTNNGTVWTSAGLTDFYIYSIITDDSGNVFAGVVGRTYKSTNNGSSWTAIDFNSQNQPLTAFITNSVGYIFAGFEDNSVYRSRDHGVSWTLINSGIVAFVSSFTINDSGYIYTGTENYLYGGGVFKSIEPTTSIKENNFTPVSFSLAQNYPNPFNPTTNFRFQISDLGFVSLKIYNIFGSEIATLVNEILPAGNYEREWNAEIFSSGMYFYRLQSGSISETKKLILLK